MFQDAYFASAAITKYSRRDASHDFTTLSRAVIAAAFNTRDFRLIVPPYFLCYAGDDMKRSRLMISPRRHFRSARYAYMRHVDTQPRAALARHVARRYVYRSRRWRRPLAILPPRRERRRSSSCGHSIKACRISDNAAEL